MALVPLLVWRLSALRHLLPTTVSHSVPLFIASYGILFGVQAGLWMRVLKIGVSLRNGVLVVEPRTITASRKRVAGFAALVYAGAVLWVFWDSIVLI